jgi:hypothetical protein
MRCHRGHILTDLLPHMRLAVLRTSTLFHCPLATRHHIFDLTCIDRPVLMEISIYSMDKTR